MIRLLLYGDIDLNLIDGSAVWLTSLVEVLGGLKDAQVSVLQKTPITRDTVIREATRLPRVHFVDPWALTVADGIPHDLVTTLPKNRLAPGSAATLIQALDQVSTYDIILVRGMETLRVLHHNPRIVSRLWVYVTNPLQYDTEPGRAELRRIRERCARVICQTEEAKAVLLELTGHVTPEQIFILAPMIPALNRATSRLPDPAAPRLGYSGKFSGPYRILEMLDAFEEIRSHVPQAEFHVVGDKIHNSPSANGFVSRVRRRLENTPGVIWHGGVSRSEANAILAKVDVAASWRTPEFDTSVELSTKVLEYAALGLPVLMNPSPIQQRLFGPNYPAYVSTRGEFIEHFLALSNAPDLYRTVSDHVRRVASEHTFQNHQRRLLPELQQSVQRVTIAEPRPTLLWTGHDFKFLRPIREMVEATGLYRSLSDQHDGHRIRDVEKSRRLLREADVIFCEWCLGNAEWYSHHKQLHQRLVIRLHRQEIELPFLDRIHWGNVDYIIFIAEWLREEFLSRFPEMADRALLIHNAIDFENIDQQKLPGAQFNLGLLGYCPMLKAPHRAVEILNALKRLDRRYTLFIKGRSPQELPWLWRRPEEKAYYLELSAAIDSSRYANSIIFEPHTEGVGAWLSKIGFILSTSEYEGSHQAVAEGMASGAIPVIRNWRGASQLYPNQYIFSEVNQAVEVVRHWGSPQNYLAETTSCRKLARSFDLRMIAARHVSLLRELLHDWTPNATCRLHRLASRPMHSGWAQHESSN
jgi:glycosyltransferase involved in cell wall biosynthesis